MAWSRGEDELKRRFLEKSIKVVEKHLWKGVAFVHIFPEGPLPDYMFIYQGARDECEGHSIESTERGYDCFSLVIVGYSNTFECLEFAEDLFNSNFSAPLYPSSLLKSFLYTISEFIFSLSHSSLNPFSLLIDTVQFFFAPR